ncbi:MAG TPA: hypothetical protein VF039_00630 [Longimicrobiales bacterium]
MSRTFQDSNLLKWEVYASSGPHGYATPARIVFHNLSDRSLRARYVQLEGDKADAERAVAEASPQQLAELLARAEELD